MRNHYSFINTLWDIEIPAVALLFMQVLLLYLSSVQKTVLKIKHNTILDTAQISKGEILQFFVLRKR